MPRWPHPHVRPHRRRCESHVGHVLCWAASDRNLLCLDCGRRLVGLHESRRTATRTNHCRGTPGCRRSGALRTRGPFQAASPRQLERDSPEGWRRQGGPATCGCSRCERSGRSGRAARETAADPRRCPPNVDVLLGHCFSAFHVHRLRGDRRRQSGKCAHARRAQGRRALCDRTGLGAGVAHVRGASADDSDPADRHSRKCWSRGCHAQRRTIFVAPAHAFNDGRSRPAPALRQSIASGRGARRSRATRRWLGAGQGPRMEAAVRWTGS